MAVLPTVSPVRWALDTVYDVTPYEQDGVGRGSEGYRRLREIPGVVVVADGDHGLLDGQLAYARHDIRRIRAEPPLQGNCIA